MKQVIFILVFLPFAIINAQMKMPGGVRGAYAWQITEVIQNGKAQWRSMLRSHPDTGLVVTGNVKSINNYPALLFGEGNTINNALNLGKLESFSLFTVCQEKDTLQERVIASLENDTAMEMVLTNQRLAALDIYRYAHYCTNMDLWPKIYSYTQNKSQDPGTVSRVLRLGRLPHGQQLPASAYSGLMPEFIVFNRFISPKERQQVESYLALKYGISLNQEFPSSYLNSKGEVIWDAELNRAYNQNIAGIGRDDLSGFNQSISESTQTPGTMKVAAINSLKGNSFLIWGDNGAPLRFDDESGIRKLQREWKISSFNFKSDTLCFETNELSLSEINPLKKGETYWMMADKSGTGKYPFRQTEYIQSLSFPSSERFIRFRRGYIDGGHSVNNVFTLLAAPSFFARSIVLSPACSSIRSGAIQTEIAGGVSPFELILTGISDKMFQLTARENKRDHVFENISQGAYVLAVTDANRNTYSEKIWVSNDHTWETKLNRNYKLIEGEELVLDASAGMPAVNYIYSWTRPDGSLVSNKELTVSQPGNYLLSVTDDNNCNSTLSINVEQIDKLNFRNIELYPNPVSGWFVLRIALERKADVNVIISDNSGMVLKQTLLQNDQYYLYNDIIRQPGVYFITLVSAFEKETLKLIVQ